MKAILNDKGEILILNPTVRDLEALKNKANLHIENTEVCKCCNGIGIIVKKES